MPQHGSRLFAQWHDQSLRRLHADRDGLSLLSYALGAAFIVVPIAISLFLFGQQTTDRANSDVGSLLSAGTPALP